MMTTLSHRRCPSLYLCDHPEAHQCISTRGGGSVPMVIQWPSVGSALLISSSRSSLAVTSHTGTSLEAHHWQKEVIRGLWLKQWESIKYSLLNMGKRICALCSEKLKPKKCYCRFPESLANSNYILVLTVWHFQAMIRWHQVTMLTFHFILHQKIWTKHREMSERSILV